MRSGRPAKNWPGRWASCSKRASIRARDMSRWIYTLAHMCKCGGSMIVNPQIKLVGAVELSWPMERRCLRQEGSSFRLSSEKSRKHRKPKATRIIVLLHQFNFGIYSQHHREVPVRQARAVDHRAIVAGPAQRLERDDGAAHLPAGDHLQRRQPGD